jgi:hypothetical protein
MRSTKTVPLVLEHELYERIERDAMEQERDAVQQCRYLIKRALLDVRPEPTNPRDPGAAA